MSASQIIVIATMIGLNALFAAFEMALASISHSRLLTLAQQNKRGASSALKMKERMEGSLAVIQLGITLVGAVAAATGGAGIERTWAPYLEVTYGLEPLVAKAVALTLFVLPLSAVTMVAELVPKVIAIHYKEIVCLWLARPMFLMWMVTAPVVSVFEGIVKGALRLVQKIFRATSAEAAASLHEFRAAVAVARTARLIGAREERILLSAAQFPVRPIEQILIPAADISMIHAKSSLADALIQAHLDLHTRFPVCAIENDPQTIQGYVTFKDLVVTLKMNPSAPNLESIMRPLKRFIGKSSIADVLEFMIREKVHITLVESEQGKILGLVSLEDILEEMVGDIEDEFDHLPTHVHPTGNGWIMGGGVPLDLVAATTGVTLAAPPSPGRGPVFADWLVQTLGRPVKKGESISTSGLLINVRKLRRKKLSECFVTSTGHSALTANQ